MWFGNLEIWELRMDSDDNSRSNIRDTTTKYYFSCWVVALIATFVSSQYLNRDSWANIVSFIPNEPPGNVQTDCLPEPIGVHYFGDLVSLSCHAMEKNPYYPPIGFNYFPLAYLVGKPFSWLLPLGLIYPLVMFVAFFGFLILKLRRLRSQESPQFRYPFFWVLGVVLLSSPGIAILDRGNVQLFVLIGMAGWLGSELRSRPNLGAVWLGIATGIKGYPVFFALRYVKSRNWRALAIFTASALTCYLVPLWIMGNGILTNTRLLFEQIQAFRAAGSVDTITRYNTSLRAALGVIDKSSISSNSLPDVVNKLGGMGSSHYTLVVLFLALLIVAISFSKYVHLFELTALGAVFCCLLPELVATYVLGFFWLPLFTVGYTEVLNKNQRLITILISFILVPKGFPVFDSGLLYSLTSIANPLLMLCILGIIGFSVIVRRKNESGFSGDATKIGVNS